jgi:hypothetical protein
VRVTKNRKNVCVANFLRNYVEPDKLGGSRGDISGDDHFHSGKISKLRRTVTLILAKLDEPATEITTRTAQ